MGCILEAGKYYEAFPVNCPNGEATEPLLATPLLMEPNGFGTSLNVSLFVRPKFFASTSGGVCRIKHKQILILIL